VRRRNVIGAGFRVGANGFEGDAAGQFDSGAAVDARIKSRFSRSQVVEQQVTCAALEGFMQLDGGADLDFEGALCPSPVRARRGRRRPR